MARHRSSASPLALAYAALIVYASLYPFSDWRPVATTSALDWLVLPWPRGWGRFDLWSNLLGYLPFGLLVAGALVRSGVRSLTAMALAIAIGSLLSLTMEELQNFLPQRVPSAKDWLLNTSGAAVGALLAGMVHRAGVVGRWQTVRERWFVTRSAGALALLLLWPVGLLFPPPVPLALGEGAARLPEMAAQALEGSSLGAWLAAWRDASEAADPDPPTPALEALAVGLGVVAPCLLAFSIARAGWRRWVLAAGAIGLGFITTSLSTALNFGPEHMFAWQTDNVQHALMLAAIVVAVVAWLPRRVAAALGLVALTAMVVVVGQVPADPYYAESLQAWEQGRFIRFHGLAQWVGWLWPYAALLYLLVRVGVRNED